MEERIRRQKSSILAVTPLYGEKTVGLAKTKEDKIIRLHELQEEYAALEAEIREYIPTLKSYFPLLTPQEQLILTLRYIEGYSWKKVACFSAYSESHCFEINRVLKEKIEK